MVRIPSKKPPGQRVSLFGVRLYNEYFTIKLNGESTDRVKERVDQVLNPFLCSTTKLPVRDSKTKNSLNVLESHGIKRTDILFLLVSRIEYLSDTGIYSVMDVSFTFCILFVCYLL